MKKENLLFAGAMALCMVSCTQTEFEQLDATSKAKSQGIAFAVSVDEEAGTRAAYEPFNTVFNHKWYADKDKIGVLYKKDTKVTPNNGVSGTEIVTNKGWMGTSATEAFEFKATASGTSGYFVANGDDNTLWLGAPTNLAKGYTETEKPVFRAYWPGNAELADGKITLGNYAAAEQNQTTTDGYGIAENAFMVSESDDNYEYDANDNSVARDRFSLKFKRISPIVYFRIKTGGANNPNLNREYKRNYADKFFGCLGKLKTITLKAEGSTKDGSTLTQSMLTFNSNDKWDMTAKNVYDPTPVTDEAPNGAFIKGNNDDASSKITLGLGQKNSSNSYDGLTWSNDAVAYMTIANVDRSAYEDKKETEKVTATYAFEHIQLETSKETDNSWAYTGDNAKWIGFPTQKGYDLDSVPYIAYNRGDNIYALEINPAFEGKLSDLFENGNLKGIKKADGTTIAKSDIGHFVSKIDITAKEDFDVIKSLNLYNITLLENTTIPAKAFDGLSRLQYLNLPKVTKVENVDAFPDNAYKKVFMGSYDFSDKSGTNQTAVRDRLLKKSALVEADIAAVGNIAAGFPTSGVIFTGFKKLEIITVKSGAVIGGAAFKDCEALTTVQFPQGTTNGSVSLLEGANSQFMGCCNGDFKTISISNTVIPDLAFSGCTYLKNVINGNGEAIVPTAIGISSFEGCKAISDMDLSKAATIGAAAFKNCKALRGNNKLNPARTVLYVNAIKHVADEAFANCENLKYISFANAETIGLGILAGTNCTEIEFLKPFTVIGKTTAATNFFGGTESSETNKWTVSGKLFCAKGQTGVSVNTITLKGNTTDSANVSTEFTNGITKYAE